MNVDGVAGNSNRDRGSDSELDSVDLPNIVPTLVPDEKLMRLVDWNAKRLCHVLKDVVA